MTMIDRDVTPERRLDEAIGRLEARDEPTVCIAHGRFIPCRSDGEHRYTASPHWVKAVRDYQGSPIEGLTWEPAWSTSVTKPRASCTYEPKHRADVAPAVVQCCGEVIACTTCGEPIT